VAVLRVAEGGCFTYNTEWTFHI